MNKPTRYELAEAFWTASFQYLTLVETVALRTVEQGNTFIIVQEYTRDSPGEDDYSRETCWSDHVIIIPLLFNLYHGIELLVKGFLFAGDRTVKPKHGIHRICKEFRDAFPDEIELSDFFMTYTSEEGMPPLIANFLQENGLQLDDLYQAVRYPADQSFNVMRSYFQLKYKGEEGLAFFNDLADGIAAARIAAVRLGLALDPRADG